MRVKNMNKKQDDKLLSILVIDRNYHIQYAVLNPTGEQRLNILLDAAMNNWLVTELYESDLIDDMKPKEMIQTTDGSMQKINNKLSDRKVNIIMKELYTYYLSQIEDVIDDALDDLDDEQFEKFVRGVKEKMNEFDDGGK